MINTQFNNTGDFQSQNYTPHPDSINPNIEKDRDVYSYYRTVNYQPATGYNKDISITATSQNTTRFELNPDMFNLQTMSLSFTYSMDATFAEPNIQAFIPNYYFPWIKSFKIFSQPNSTLLFECNDVPAYTLMHGMYNLNHNKRRREEGFIVQSKRSKCGYEPWTLDGMYNDDPFQVYGRNIIQPPNYSNIRIMVDNLNDVSIGTYSKVDTPIPTTTINIKLSDLFFDSLFNRGDILLKYGCYIIIEWNTRDNIVWGTNSQFQTQVLNCSIFVLNNPLSISNINLQIDVQQNQYLIEKEDNDNLNAKIWSIPYIYEYDSNNENLIFQFYNQSMYPQKLFKMYTSLLMSKSGDGNYLPLTISNILFYNSESELYTNPINCGYYDKITLSLENKIYDIINLDNSITGLNMLLRKINKEYKHSSHSGVKSLLAICCVPFKFDATVKDDRKMYYNGESHGIDISRKILPINIQLNKINDFPANSKLKCFCVVMRSFKFHNGQFYYI